MQKAVIMAVVQCSTAFIEHNKKHGTTMVGENADTSCGEKLVHELRWINNIIRDKLVVMATIIHQIDDSASTAQTYTQVDERAATSVRWTVRVHCLRYCSFVQAHHHHQAVAWFPKLRRVNPALHIVINKLETDHTIISRYLDEIETVSREIVHDQAVRSALSDAMSMLATHLLTHLDDEEAKLAPILCRIQSWPLD